MINLDQLLHIHNESSKYNEAVLNGFFGHEVSPLSRPQAGAAEANNPHGGAAETDYPHGGAVRIRTAALKSVRTYRFFRVRWRCA